MSGNFFERSERILINGMRRPTRDKKVHVRSAVLIMLDENFSYGQIALRHGIDMNTVGKWKRKYREDDLDEYLKDNWQARQSLISQSEIAEHESRLSETTCYTVRQAQFLEEFERIQKAELKSLI